MTGSSSTEDVTNIYRSKSDYSKSETKNTGASTGFMFFSASVQASEMQQEIGNKENIVIETSSSISLFTATLDNPGEFKLAPAFKRMVDALPVKYDRENGDPLREPYQALIHYYGTHYVHFAEFGGTAKMKNVVAQSYTEKKSDSTMSMEASASYGGASAGASRSSSDSSETRHPSRPSRRTC